MHLRYYVWGVLVAVTMSSISCDDKGTKRAPQGRVAQTQAQVQRISTTRPAEPADNSYCLVCHANFKREELAARHQEWGVGCEKCHGTSDKHSSDENGITPPEIMYAKEAINDGCYKCHTKEMLAPAPVHRPVLEGTAVQDRYCTSCHGQHTMAQRTRRWDKVTGKLISDDGVRMVEDPKK